MGSDLKKLLTGDPIIAPTPGEVLFCDRYPYQEFLDKKNRATEEWKGMTDDERSRFSNSIKKYYKGTICHCCIDMCSASKNNYLVENESTQRLNEGINLIPIPYSKFDYEKYIYYLIEDCENIENIEKLYRVRKLSTRQAKDAGVNSAEANNIRYCLRQGRELYLSGKSGGLLAKPLNFFYGITAYSYAAIILNNPIRYNIDNIPNSHGLSQSKDGKCMVIFGGDTPSGTFSDLFYSFPTQQIYYDYEQNGFFTLNYMDSIFCYSKNRVSIGINTLLSMVPELKFIYESLTMNKSAAYTVNICTKMVRNSVYYNFEIGDGLAVPDETRLLSSFNNISPTYESGKVIVDVPNQDIKKINPIYIQICMASIGISTLSWES
jgi:hypothetical protein